MVESPQTEYANDDEGRTKDARLMDRPKTYPQKSSGETSDAVAL